ncbi:hypothetical protein [Polaromonas sp. CG_9.11]|uniref:hypothetical protein n=1 Tax=Polaromonas sp. CG_9.11 TaxID=2787730 RepID=UPI0018C9927A|nr:hypothetical protein [Polaromonas sp. CG_9.11]MBG6075441.1 hypothetical protein [Polaromonas sp. CG_9.11]
MKAFNLKIIVFSIAAALAGQAAHAVLERTGPIDAANGFPRWYMDTTGLNFELCLPLTPAELSGGHCLLLPGDAPATPEVFPGQFFDEHFWWQAGAALTPATGGKALLVLGLEAAFSADVAPGNQIAFSRIRVRLAPVPVTGTYRFIHPYGEESVVGTRGERIFFTDDVGIGAPGDFTGATKGRLGPFLLPSQSAGAAEIAPVAGPVPGKLYIADPARIGPVTGSPLPDFLGSDGIMHNHNIFRIEGPRGSNLGGIGVDFIETTGFSLMGRIYTGQVPSLVAPDRATYTRSGGDQKVDVFATAYRSAASRLPGSVRPAGVAPVTSFFNAPCGTTLDAAGNLIAYTPPASNALETQMVAQKNSRWGQSRIASGLAIPDSVCLKDNSGVNINGQSTPAYHPLPLNDTVKVTDVLFDPVNATLTVKAMSSDQVAPPTLTVADYNIPLSFGVANISGVTSPPAKIRVLSSIGGMGESNDVATGNAGTPLISQAPVSTAPPAPVVTPPPPPPPPPVVVIPNPSETVTVTGADYVVSKNRWKVVGTTSVATAHNFTLKLAGVVGGAPCNASGRVIGTTTSVGNAYSFDFLNATGPQDPRTTNCTAVKVESALGNVTPNTTFRLK